MLCGISDPFGSLSPTLRQVTHVLLTRLPLYSPLRAFAFDLHVLGTPPALILSQDQTLMLKASGPVAHGGRDGPRVRVCSLMSLVSSDAGFGDEPESLILAQSERWRHA